MMMGFASATATATATAKALNAERLWRGLIDALSGRAGRFISFASPKETNQRKGDPAYAPRKAGVPSLQTIERWLRNSLAALAQTVLAEFPPACLPLGAAEGDPVAHPHPQPLPLKGRGDACECLWVKVDGFDTRRHTSRIGLFQYALAFNGLSPRYVAPRSGARPRLATDVGNPGGAQMAVPPKLSGLPLSDAPCRAKRRTAFSLVRFFWPRKRNEPARPAAKGINQPAPQALSLSEVAVAVAVAAATAAATTVAPIPPRAGGAQ